MLRSRDQDLSLPTSNKRGMYEPVVQLETGLAEEVVATGTEGPSGKHHAKICKGNAKSQTLAFHN